MASCRCNREIIRMTGGQKGETRERARHAIMHRSRMPADWNVVAVHCCSRSELSRIPRLFAPIGRAGSQSSPLADIVGCEHSVSAARRGAKGGASGSKMDENTDEQTSSFQRRQHDIALVMKIQATCPSPRRRQRRRANRSNDETGSGRARIPGPSAPQHGRCGKRRTWAFNSRRACAR